MVGHMITKQDNQMEEKNPLDSQREQENLQRDVEAFAKQQEIPGQQEDQSETTDSNQSVKEETIT